MGEASRKLIGLIMSEVSRDLIGLIMRKASRVFCVRLRASFSPR